MVQVEAEIIEEDKKFAFEELHGCKEPSGE
jgi:hypothetical protein